MDWKQLYFGIEGRIGRKVWWISHLVQWISVTAVALVLVFLASLFDPAGMDKQSPTSIDIIAFAIVAIGYIALIWSSICLNAKRWHDTDNSGWMQLIGIIPLIGLWALISNGFLRGTEGPNRFGPDPLAGQ